MEAGSLIIPLLKAYWWFIPLFMLSSFFSSSVGKGLIGEWRVRLLLRQSLDRKLYRRLHDVTLSTRNGSIQIDHLLISPFGIFVIETKHMSGWIFGHPDQEHWTQKIHKKSLRFQNPLLQNHKQAKTLESLLGVSKDTAHSVICFIGTHRFKSPMPDNVTGLDTLLDYIQTFTTRLFSEKQVRAMYKAIQKDKFTFTWEAHIKSQHDTDGNRLCPECGGRLVLITKKSEEGMHEQFWDCSSGPECRLTQSIS
jgi:restriction system protein